MIISLAVNSTNMILSGNYGGVYRTIDNGEYWSLRNDGLTNYSITSLIFNSDDIAFAGSLGDGVFRSVNSTTSAETHTYLHGTFSLSQNYLKYDSTLHSIMNYNVWQDSESVFFKLDALPAECGRIYLLGSFAM